MESKTEKILDFLDSQEDVREELLNISRKSIRKSSSAISAFHRDDLEEYENKIDKIRKDVEGLNDLVEKAPHFSRHGSYIAAHREFSEAVLLKTLVNGGDFPDPDDLNVSYRGFAQAMAEVIGELRRHVLNLLRDDDLDDAREIHERMERVFDQLEQFDYPDSILSGMRHRRDSARKGLEKTRADITRAIRERKLEKALKKVEGDLDEV